MAGNKLGGIKAALSNKAKHGKDFYKRIGSIGGKRSTNGGFAANPDLARVAGARGGIVSRRGKSNYPLSYTLNKNRGHHNGLGYKDFVDMLREKQKNARIARHMGVSETTVAHWRSRYNKELRDDAPLV